MMMPRIHLTGPVDPFDVYQKLAEHYFEPVESTIRRKVLPTIRRDLEGKGFKGAQSVIDALLKESVQRLQQLIPGAAVFWDDQIDVSRTYDTYPQVVVDVVDGARELRKGGTNVTSTLTIIDYKGNMPLTVVSYPFESERIIDFDSNVSDSTPEVYCLPTDLMKDGMPCTREKLQDYYRLTPGKEVQEPSSLRFAEKYDDFDDELRRHIDALRGKVKSYVVPVGSITKMMMNVVRGSCDVFLIQRKDPIHFYDYLAPAKIIRDLGGCVTDIQGQPLGKREREREDLPGLIIASHKETLATFLSALNESR